MRRPYAANCAAAARLLLTAAVAAGTALPVMHLGFCGSTHDDAWPAVVALARKSFEGQNPILSLPGTSSFQVQWHLAYADSKISEYQEGFNRMIGNRLATVSHPPVHALIGCTFSTVSEAMATMGAILQVVQIAWVSGSPSLSDKTMYPYFLRTRGTSQATGDGFMAVCAYYGWSRVGFLYEADGSNAEAPFTRASAIADSLSIEVVGFAFFSWPEAAAVNQSVWGRVMKTAAESGLRVFGVTFSSTIVNILLNVSLAYNMQKSLLILWEFDAAFPNMEPASKAAFGGMMGLSDAQSGVNMVAKRMNDAWTELNFTQLQQLGIPDPWVSKLKETPDVFTLSPFAQYRAHEFDAIAAALMAFQNLLDAGKTADEIRGLVLRDELYRLSFTGASGMVSFQAIHGGTGGDRDASSQILYQVRHGGDMLSIARLSSTALNTLDLLFHRLAVFPDGGSDPRMYDTLITCQDRNTYRFVYPNLTQSCVFCPEGSVPNSLQDACVQCPAGQYAWPESIQCNDCPEGRYAGSRGLTKCESCPPGNYTDLKASLSCMPCPRGTWSFANGASECAECMVGKFSGSTGARDCENCAIGTYADSVGRSACSPCEAVVEGSTTITIEGITDGSVSSSQCRCAAGLQLETLVTASPTGNGSNGSNGSAPRLLCAFCPPEMYATTVMDHCLACDHGTIPSDTRDQCLECPRGRFAANASSACGVCPAGTFSDHGSQGCLACPAGKYAPAESQECVRCPRDTYAVEGSGSCIECPHPFGALEGSQACLTPDPALLTVYVSVFVLLFLAILIVLMTVRRPIAIHDVSLEDEYVCVTTTRPHGIITGFCCMSSVRVTIRGTRHPALDGKIFRVVPKGIERLKLTDEYGQNIKTRLDSSCGAVLVTNIITEFMASGWKAPTGILVPVLLTPVVLLLAKFELDAALFYCGAAVSLCAALLIAFAARRIPAKTHMQVAVQSYRRRLLRANPHPTATPRGPGRAITAGRLWDFYDAFSGFIRDRNMYYVSSNILMRLTKYHKLSFAEMAGPVRLEWFVSHYWGTPFRAFVETIRQHAIAISVANAAEESKAMTPAPPGGPLQKKTVGPRDLRPELESWATWIPEVVHRIAEFGGVCRGDGAGTMSQLSQLSKLSSLAERHPWREMTYWVCSFSNNQWSVEEEVGTTWEDSSFYLALRSGYCQGTAMVMDESALPLTRSWCLFEVLQTFLLEQSEATFRGLLLCTTEGVLNFGSTGIDVVVSIGRRLADLRVESATASRQEDKLMIDSLVSSCQGGFAVMNTFVRKNIQKSLHAAKERFEGDYHDLDEVLSSSLAGFSERAAAPAAEGFAAAPRGVSEEPLPSQATAWGDDVNSLSVLMHQMGPQVLGEVVSL